MLWRILKYYCVDGTTLISNALTEEFVVDVLYTVSEKKNVYECCFKINLLLLNKSIPEYVL